MADPGAAQTLSAAAIAALHEGNKIAAIKLVRAERGLQLKEAKDLVEAYIAGQPQLARAYAAGQAQARRSALLWLAIIAAVVVALVWYFGGASAH